MEALQHLRDGRPIRAIGLMSGTSLDGVDGALLETDGEGHVNPIKSVSRPYTAAERAVLQEAVAAALDWDEVREGQAIIGQAEDVLHQSHVEIVAALAIGGAELVGFHGQTVLHRPERALTWQIGDGGRLAQQSGLPTIFDFRSADMAAGGQGAPLAPLYHAALVADAGLAGPVGILNLGGVANITLVGAGDLLAFDTGPANGLLDQWVEHAGHGRFDKDGAMAAQGKVDEGCLARLMAHPYFGQLPPKSLDRYDFDLAAVAGLSMADGAATLTAFTAQSIALALKQLPQMPTLLIASGGGSHNPVMLAMIGAQTGCQIRTAQSLGWDGDVIEAQCFAYLAARAVRGLALSMPGTTGVPAAQTGGQLALPSK
ncbi:MAG: anhydro-N-acetylmuramic acid kinase [Alphaproteobacteria bacterium]